MVVQGLFNFKPSVRPVPLECHIQGFPGKFYCPRMATMNKPAYAAIQVHQEPYDLYPKIPPWFQNLLLVAIDKTSSASCLQARSVIGSR